VHLRVTSAYRARVEEYAQRLPVLWCVVQPDDWRNSTEGGFYTSALRKRYPLVKESREKNALSDTTLRAVNALQHTPWCVNGELLDKISSLPSHIIAEVVDTDAFERLCNQATELREIPAIYNVVHLDDRGRIYPAVGTLLKPQGDDLALALLRFTPSQRHLHPSLRESAAEAL